MVSGLSSVSKFFPFTKPRVVPTNRFARAKLVSGRYPLGDVHTRLSSCAGKFVYIYGCMCTHMFVINWCLSAGLSSNKRVARSGKTSPRPTTTSMCGRGGAG